jgi:hypothetical protein
VLRDRNTSTAREGKDHEHGYFPVLSHIAVFKRLDSYLSVRDGANELCGQKAGRLLLVICVLRHHITFWEWLAIISAISP